MRFARDIADALMATAWWDWEHDVLTERLADFSDLRRFLHRYAPCHKSFPEPSTSCHTSI